MTISDFCVIFGLSILEVRKINTINDRIIQIIDEECGGNRSEFARRLEITPTYAAQLYKGERIPGDRIISSICREFNIRREWLENGEDPMKLPEPDADMAYLNALLSGDDAETIRFIKKFLRTYTTLPAEDQRVIDNLIHTLLNEK